MWKILVNFHIFFFNNTINDFISLKWILQITIITGEELKSKKHTSFPQQEGFDLSTYIDTVNDTGHTAIHLAVNSTFLPGIEVLLQKGADVTIPNKENNTLLHSAAIDNRAKSLRKLSESLRAISKEGNYTWKQELQRKNGISYIPVMLATEKTTIKVITCIVRFHYVMKIAKLPLSYFLQMSFLKKIACYRGKIAYRLNDAKIPLTHPNNYTII